MHETDTEPAAPAPMGPAARLRDAAVRLGGRPWRAESWEEDACCIWWRVYDGSGVGLADRTNERSARMVAALGTAALMQIERALYRMAAECLVELDYEPWHEKGCGMDVAKDWGSPHRCECFDDALALASAVLGLSPDLRTEAQGADPS